MKVPITAHKVKHHLKARTHAKAAKKTAKKSLHQIHADNLYKLAHPENPKRQKAIRRTLTHVVLPVALIIATATFAIGAEVVSNSSKSLKSMPAVPANSKCRIFDDSSGGLAAQDSRIGMKLENSAQFPNKITITTTGYTRNYVYAVDGNGFTYNASNLSGNVLNSRGIAFSYAKVCIVDPGPAMPPFNSRTAMVDQQYRDFTGVGATADQQAYWANVTKNMSADSAAKYIVTWFVNNEAAQRGPLVRLYKAYYKRWPDQGGYAYWIKKMKANEAGGMTAKQSLTKVSDSFASANEFKTKYGSVSNQEFVLLVYNNVLDRSPDQGGYDYWVNKLNKKTITRGGVMLAFSESSEYQRKQGLNSDLEGVTLRMLRRPATDAELAQWNDDESATTLAYPILFQSAEYANRPDLIK